MSEFTFVDLFAGIGGFRRALESVGGKCIGFSEIAPDAIDTYCRNYGDSESDNFGDITKLKTLPRHDFMTAGVPCQSWSIAGRNLGFDDDRGQLWNDTVYLLNKVRPKAFIFENVKGLADPRNAEALSYILRRIKEAGYTAEKYLLNSYDYGVPQHRERIYIIGFRNKKYAEKFHLPEPVKERINLRDVLDVYNDTPTERKKSEPNQKSRWSLSTNENGFNDYFLFNDIRNGDTTIHSWDIIETTQKEKKICNLLLQNRRKKLYGPLDGNPLSLQHFHDLDASIKPKDIQKLVDKGILKEEQYLFELNYTNESELTEEERMVVKYAQDGTLFNQNPTINVDTLYIQRVFKVKRIDPYVILQGMVEKGIARCVESRYDFRHRRISTGLNGVNRIFLPSSSIYPTMVASDTNDYVTTVEVSGDTPEEYKQNFLNNVYNKKAYRQITKEEACRIQGFPADFILPAARPRWMKLIGNSVSVPVIRQLANAVVKTGVFDSK